jgi:HK97 family phage major capsid protein
MNPRVAALSDEFAANKEGLDYLDQLAAAEGRDLTDVERAQYDGALTRMEQIEADLAAIAKGEQSAAAVAAVTADLNRSAVRIENVTPRSPVSFDPSKASTPMREIDRSRAHGEALKTLAQAALGRAGNEKFRQYIAAVDELGRVDVEHGVSADGTAPETIEGDLIKFVDAQRYAVNATRSLPMPDNHAPTFKRPRVTQRTTVAVQASEGDILSSQRMQLTGDTVTKATYGGVVALSEQEVDWTDPALYSLVAQDLAESYAIATDGALCAAIEAAFAASTPTEVSDTAASDEFIAAIATASGAVYASSKKLADTLFVAIDRWVYLASLVDGDGRPLFPMVGPQNVPGTGRGSAATFTGYNVLGLDVVVDPNFSSGVWGVARSDLIESYEQNKGLLTIAAPSTLETQIAYRGYFATNVYDDGVNALAPGGGGG